MWKCGYRYLSCEKLHKICQLVPTLQIREQVVNIIFFSAVSCSFLNASIHFLWTLNYAMTEYRVILLTANFSICISRQGVLIEYHCIFLQFEFQFQVIFNQVAQWLPLLLCLIRSKCLLQAKIFLLPRL